MSSIGTSLPAAGNTQLVRQNSLTRQTDTRAVVVVLAIRWL